MKKRPYSEPAATRSLGIEQWHHLGLEGNALPVTITLEGDSMRPLIRRGRDRVTILPLMRPLKRGDVVLFKGGETRYVVHRVYRMKDGLVQTLGDNCVNPDPWMPPEKVWGLVVKMERGGRAWRLDSRAGRAFGLVWMGLYPARRMYLRCRGLAARVYRKVFPRKK